MVMFVSSHWSAHCCPLHWSAGNSPFTTLESNVHMPQNMCRSIWCPNGLGCIAYYRVIMGQFIGIHQIIININWCFTARYSDVGRIYSSCIIQCAANKYKQNIITMITHIWSIQSPPPLPKLSGQNPFHDYQLQYGPLLPTTVCYSTVCISYIGFIFELGYSVRRRGGAKLGQFHSHFHHWHFIKCS